MQSGMKRGNSAYGHQGMKRSRADGSEYLRILVRGQYAGKLIGKSGENMKRIRDKYGVKINGLSAVKAPERVIHITGPVSQCVEAVRELLPQCPESCYKASNFVVSPFELNLLVNTDVVGILVGPGGSRMKEVAQEFKVQLKVYPECLAGSNERVVSIGSKNVDVAIQALASVMSILATGEMRGETIFYNPDGNGTRYSGNNNFGNNHNNSNNFENNFGNNFNNNFNNNNVNNNTMDNVKDNLFIRNKLGMLSNNNNFGGPIIPKEAGPTTEDDIVKLLVNYRDFKARSNIERAWDFGSVETVTTLEISSDLCGGIVGKGGQNIKYIKQVSGARIDTSPPERDDDKNGNRTVTMQGTQDQIQIAQQLMAQCIERRNAKRELAGTVVH